MKTSCQQTISGIKGLTLLTLLTLLALVVMCVPAAGFESNTVPNLTFWLKADAGVTTNSSGVVTEWQDQSPFGNDATLLGGNPTLHPTNFANGNPAVWFSGTHDSLSFPEVNNIRTTFWVLNESPSATESRRIVLGHPSSHNFHRGLNKALFGSSTHLNVSHGSIYLNGDLVGFSTLAPTNPSILAMTTLGNVEAGYIGRDRSYTTARIWHGYIAEILCFSHVLNEEELNTVGLYLSQKYGIDSDYTEPGPKTRVRNDPELEYQGWRTVSVSGSLLETNDAPNTAYIYWGTTDGKSDPDAWQHSELLDEADIGDLDATLTGLPIDTAFYYTFAVSNATTKAFATPSGSFRTTLFPGPWAYRIPLTVAGYSGSETLTNFPVAVTLGEHLNGFSYDQFLSPPHHDLLFLDDRNVELPYEVESWDTNGLSHVWVRLPRLRDAHETFYAYWGRANRDPPPASTNGATWSEDYRGVWHMSETITHGQTLHDSTAYGNHGVFYDPNDNSTAGHPDGVVGGAISYGGNGAYVQIPHSVSLGPKHLTLELWAKSTPATWSANGVLLSKRDSYFMHPDGGSRNVRMFVSAPVSYVTSYAPPEIQTWRYYVATYDGSTLRFYNNGVQVASAAGSSIVNPDPTPLYLGRDGATTRYLDGWLDEVRISGVARSADWIQAAWSNQVPGSTFIEAQSVEYVWQPRGTLIHFR